MARLAALVPRPRANLGTSSWTPTKQLRMQGGGRGSLGFETLTTEDVQTGLTTTTTYAQQFPNTGMPTATETRTSGGTLIASSTNSYPAPPAPGAYPLDGVHQVYAEQSIEESRRLAHGSVYKTVTTTQVQDSYGNVTDITVTTTDGSQSRRMASGTIGPRGSHAHSCRFFDLAHRVVRIRRSGQAREGDR